MRHRFACLHLLRDSLICQKKLFENTARVQLALSQVRICRPSRQKWGNDLLQKWSNFHERCAMYWKEWKIKFLIFILWNIVYFIHNFQLFLPTKNVNKKNTVSKNAYFSETDIWVFVRFVIFEIWSILYSTFIVNWSGNLIQKYKPENQLARGIQF